MEYVLKKQGGGKTTSAILKASKTGAYIICATREDVRRIYNQAEKMGLQIRQPVSIAEYLHDMMRNSFVRNIIIDDLERILPSFFPALDIEMITATVDLQRDETK